MSSSLSRSLAGLALIYVAGCGGIVDFAETDADGLHDDFSSGASRGNDVPDLPSLSVGSSTGVGGLAIDWSVGGGPSSVGGAGRRNESIGGASTGGLGSGGDFRAENVDCTGDFGEPETLFEDVGWMPQALSPTRDGLEIFYARNSTDSLVDDSGQRRFAMRTRNSLDEDFGDPVALTELDDVCEEAEPGTQPSALDVSGDALRLYIGCNSFAGSPYPLGPLLLATRADKDSPFVVAPEPIGTAGISLGLTKDELEGFGSSTDPSIDEILYYERSSVDEVFSQGVPIAGGVQMLNPEPAPDGLLLLGVMDDVTPGIYQIGYAVRAAKGAPFSAVSVVGMPPASASSDDYSPALTADCREVYFLRVFSAPDYHAEVMVSRR